MHFYVPNGGRISDDLGQLIETGGNTKGLYVEKYFPGEKWPNPVLKEGKGLVILGKPVQVTHPTPLSELVKEDMGDCHWSACRENVFSKDANISARRDGLYRLEKTEDGKVERNKIELDPEFKKSEYQNRTSNPSQDAWDEL